MDPHTRLSLLTHMTDLTVGLHILKQGIKSHAGHQKAAPHQLLCLLGATMDISMYSRDDAENQGGRDKIRTRKPKLIARDHMLREVLPPNCHA